MFRDNMKQVATGLLQQFGATGKIIIPDTKPDPITGEGGSSSEFDVLYFREYITGRELMGSRIDEKIADRIENDDAMVYAVFDQKIMPNWSFKDDEGLLWNIISAAAIETQGGDVMYEVHIRK